MPFKTGAFHAAIAAGVPIVPVVCSTTHNKIDLNRWDNGKVICEMMDPIDVSSYTKDNVRELATYCHDLIDVYKRQALGYAGQMFAFYAVVLPVALVWKARSIHTNLPYRVWGCLLYTSSQPSKGSRFHIIDIKI